MYCYTWKCLWKKQIAANNQKKIAEIKDRKGPNRPQVKVLSKTEIDPPNLYSLHVLLRLHNPRLNCIRSRRRKLAPLPQMMPIPSQHKRYRSQEHRKQPQQRRRPPRVQCVIHLKRKQRKPSSKQTPHDRISRKRRSSDEQIRVDDIIEQRQEDPDDREPHWEAGEHGDPE